MITIYKIPGCELCERLCFELRGAGVPFMERMLDPYGKEIEELGLAYAQFPVVFVNGAQLPPMTLEDYVSTITNLEK